MGHTEPAAVRPQAELDRGWDDPTALGEALAMVLAAVDTLGASLSTAPAGSERPAVAVAITVAARVLAPDVVEAEEGPARP